jgi:DNA-binding MarR family transcriptional regulator
MGKLNTSRFASEVAEYYQGESAMLSFIDSLEQQQCVVNPSLISERLNLARGTVTATLRALERKKLAKTQVMEHDRRRVEVRLTEKGRLVAREKKEKVRLWCLALIETIGSEQFSLLVNLIDTAIDSLGYQQEGQR